MNTIQRLIDILFVPWQSVAPVYSLAFGTLLVTVFALIIYKYTSNQLSIRKAKDRIKAHFVEVWIYIDDPVLILKAQAGIFLNAAKYLGLALVPLAIMFLPVMVMLINFEHRYHYRQLYEGESVLLKVKIKSGSQPGLDAFKIELPPTLKLDAPPLRIAGKNSQGNDYREVDYRIKALKSGVHDINLAVGDSRVSVYILADSGSPFRVNPVNAAGFAANFWHPSYSPLKPGSLIERIEIAYPETTIDFFGWKTYWLWPFLILMFVFAFALKPLIKVEF